MAPPLAQRARGHACRVSRTQNLVRPIYREAQGARMADEAATVPAPQQTAPKIKTTKPKQRARDEKEEKAKLGGGNLKRWYEYHKERDAIIGRKAKIYIWL